MPAPSQPRPSASIILIAPTNKILLLQRVQKSSTYPSAWVFPGGNLSQYQDGMDEDLTNRDSEAYRIAAIRELFEESGVLLVRRTGQEGTEVIEITEELREQGRSETYNNKVWFRGWLATQNFVAATDILVPFTRWITPETSKRRFTTQMYLCFLPLNAAFSSSTTLPHPTPDAGQEHVSAAFLSATDILRKAKLGELLLMTPQFYLIWLLSHFLGVNRELEQERKALMKFVRDTAPEETVICAVLQQTLSDGRIVLDLGGSGPEVDKDGSGRSGDPTKVVVMNLRAKDSKHMELWSKEKLMIRQHNL